MDHMKALAAYSKAMKDFRKKEYQGASEKLKAFLKEFDSEKELIDRAKMYINICEGRRKKQTKALKSLDDYYQYAVYNLNMGYYEEALELLDKAQEKNPREGKVFYLKANVFCLMGTYEECLENLKKALKIDKFFGILAHNEPDFEPLWEDKKFKLITRMA